MSEIALDAGCRRAYVARVRTAARRVVPVVLLATAAGYIVARLIQADHIGFLALDYKLEAAQRLIDGQTLYPTSGPEFGDYPYPPIWAIVTTPLLALPHVVAQYTAGILCAFAVLAALWVVGLRDPWCYAIVLFSAPLTLVATVGNPTAFITLLVALSYRYGSAPAGVAVAIKLYPWPMLLWGLLVRGRRDFAIGIVATLAAIFVPWALIGFDGIDHYLTITRIITGHAREDSGVLSPPVQIALTAAALAGMWARRGKPADSFAFATLAMLTASPVLWGFYLVTALVPLAIHRPRVSPVWVLPLALWGLDYYGRLAVMFALLAWCGIGAPSLRRLTAAVQAS